MSTRCRFILIGIVAMAFAVASMIHSTPGSAQGSAPAIYLKALRFTPASGPVPQIPPGLRIAGYAQNQRGYYIVQFRGPIEQSWKDELTALGADILDYIPDFAFKVRMNPAQALRAGQLANVVRAEIFQPAYKLSPDLVKNGTQMYTVQVERGSDFGLAHAALGSTGAQVISRDAGTLIVAANPDQIDAIANVIDVAWVENFRLLQKHNEFAGGIIMGASLAHERSYDGSTQTVALADTGLGGGTADTAHTDIAPNRVVAIYNWPGTPAGCFSTIANDGAVDVSSGHGTHTTISAVGASSSGFGSGVAPGAKLVFQAVENYATVSWICSLFYGYTNGYYLTGLPSDLNQIYQQAYNAGARIHSNSWGAAGAGVYDGNSANTDAFIWNHQDMTIAFSAGNEGKDANSDGVIDNNSIASPGSAKNVITVGASENKRDDGYPCDVNQTYTDCAALKGKNETIIATYGAGFGFPANPIKDDLIAGNAEQMAAFSSRGPTADGRIKPDVVAPGTYILSGYSAKYRQQYDPAPNPVDGQYQYDGWAYPETGDHKYLGGTSMSAPLVAGGAAVVRDYYQRKWGQQASAALVKAAIINSAHDLLDENNDGESDNRFPIPNNHEGWGRVDLATATDGKSAFVDNSTGIGTNGTAIYTARRADVGEALKITVVWSDYPSTAAAGVNLVNDLDLKVTAPGGAVYLGNVFAVGWSQTAGSADRRNNVENVYLENPGTGDYTIEIKGYNVPYAPQPFALVVRGASLTDGSSPNLPDPTVTFGGAPGTAQYGITFTVTSSNNSGAQPVYTSSGACANVDDLYTMTSGTGTCTSTVTWAATDYYKGATRSQTTGAVKIDPTVSFKVPDSAANYSTFTATSSTNSSSPPVYGSSGVCTNNGAVYTMTSNTGTCNSTVTWAADNNYNAAVRTGTTQAMPGNPPALTVHVGNLTPNSQSGGSYWVAGVSTFVHDANHNPVAGAKVTATWSSGTKTSGSCTTGKSGFCAITSGRIASTNANVTFTVTMISKSGYTYAPSSNHDISGDSNGTTITVKKP